MAHLASRIDSSDRVPPRGCLRLKGASADEDVDGDAGKASNVASYYSYHTVAADLLVLLLPLPSQPSL